MRVPPAFLNDRAELVVKFSTGGFGDFTASKKVTDLGKGKPSLNGLLSMARRLDGCGEHARAGRLRRQAVSLYPDNANALNELAWFLVTTNDPKCRDASKAVELAKQAVALTDEKAGYILDTLAVAYYESGDLAQAVKYSTMAAQMPPVQPDVAKRAKQYQAELAAQGGSK